MNNQQQGNRLQLNFGFGGGDRNQYNQDSSGRAFPTTPSTFPQPVYPNQAGQQEVWGTQQQNYGNGYFMGNPYQQAAYQGQQAPSQQRFNEAANGLVHQLSHQHLGGGGRSGSPYGRQPSPSQGRPRTAGDRGHQQYGSYLGQQVPRQPSINDEEPPPKNPDKYSDNVRTQASLSVRLVGTFFKDSVQRARDRNQRLAYTPMKLQHLLTYYQGTRIGSYYEGALVFRRAQSPEGKPNAACGGKLSALSANQGTT
jgi:protein-serine/threonine kinase